MSQSRGIRVFAQGLCALLLALTLAHPAAAAKLGPTLASTLDGLANTTSVGTVIVSFNTSSGLNLSHMTALTLAGVTRGYRLPNLGMVAIPANARQVRTLANNPAVRSIWLNERLLFLNDQTRVVAGAERARDDAGFAALHGGLPVTGQGIGVLINDSGIDATHPDLPYGSRVVQNVLSLVDFTSLLGFPLLPGIEGLPDTDLNYGHGTHCAGIVAGTGAASGGRYAGVAPGAHLIGFGSGALTYILNSLGGFEYALANQGRYNIRVISNSWGSPGPFDPDNPIAIASKAAHDRGVVVVFAAGNSGPGRDTMSSDAKSPWAISVAAGTKEGGLALFSSRGVPKAERAAGDFNAPTITAPGTGREFAANAGRFTSAVVSTRAKLNLFANGGLWDFEDIAPADLPYYTSIEGTSMAAPFVAGTVALMLSANPALTPAQVRSILTRTASQIPGYSEYEIGAGYVNVYAAVDLALHPDKPYGSYGGPLDLQPFNLSLAPSVVAQAPFHIDYNPLALLGVGNNSTTFTVQSGVSLLDVTASAERILLPGDGNTIALVLTAPNGLVYSSGVGIPLRDGPTRQVTVANPRPGTWRLEIRGLLSQILPLPGLALPGPVDGTILQRGFSTPAIADIQGHPLRAEIEFALKNRMIDVLSDGLFHPEAEVTRGELARSLALNTPLRQSLAASPKYADTAGALRAIAEAVTANGSTLRDYDFTPTGMLDAAPASFSPGAPATRLDVAVALIKALSLDALALGQAGTEITAILGGQAVPVIDDGSVPSGQRGYVQLALDRGILTATFNQSPPAATVMPDEPMTRAELAAAIGRYRQVFAAGF